MMNEIWRKVAGHERFLVSNMGRVMCIDYKKQGEVADVKQSKSGEYMRVRIENENPYVHTLVAKTFIGDVADGKRVVFINGDKMDCRAANLQIVDNQTNPLAKALCVTAYNLHTGKIKTFDSIRAAAKELGISHSIISDICKNKHKSKYHAGYAFCLGEHGVEAFTSLAGDIAKENAEKKMKKAQEPLVKKAVVRATSDKAKAKTKTSSKKAESKVASKKSVLKVVPAKKGVKKEIIKENVELNDIKALNRAFSSSPVFAFNEKTGKITYFDSISEAAKNFGVSITALSLVLNGKNRYMPACLKGYKLAKNCPDSLIA